MKIAPPRGVACGSPWPGAIWNGYRRPAGRLWSVGGPSTSSRRARMPPAGADASGGPGVDRNGSLSRGVRSTCRGTEVHGCPSIRYSRYPSGRLAQRERASFTPKRSLVRSQYRPHLKPQLRGQTLTDEAGLFPPSRSVRENTGRRSLVIISARSSVAAGRGRPRVSRAPLLDVRPAPPSTRRSVRPAVAGACRG